MPRRSRSKSGIYHIMLQGINRQTIFEDDEDRERYLQILKECKVISQYKLFAYCLMSNHIHLLIKVEKEPLETIFKRIGSRYVYWYNLKYQRCGHLFQDRYKSEAIEDDAYFLTVLRYILQNPVKANLCKKLDEYRWSSYKNYKTLSEGITDIEFALELLTQEKRNQVKLFDEFINQENEDKCLDLEPPKKRVTDEELSREVSLKFNVNPIQIQNLPNDEQINIVGWMKQLEGISLRQIARITGLTVNKVFKV